MQRDEFVKEDELWKHGPEPMGGESRSDAMPSRSDGAEYVRFAHGFKANPPGMDVPNEILHYDARSGELKRVERLPGAHGFVRLSNPPGGDVDRDAPLLDQLAPAFFHGEKSVPPHLEAVADAYRKRFIATTQPEMIRFYVEMAPEWCAWVGIEAR